VHNVSIIRLAKPILEMGFNWPVDDARLQEVMDEFANAGVGGFIVARNRQGKSLEIRSQSIPKFDFE